MNELEKAADEHAGQTFMCCIYPDDYEAGKKGEITDFETRKESFIAGAQWQAKQSPWISVEERLPHDYKDKLIKLTDGSIRLAIYDSDDDGYFWSDNYADESFSPEDVTHWCPIPE